MIGDKYDVGDVVVVRQWDDMRAEFGLRADRPGSVIDVAFSFTEQMKKFCGVEFLIADVGWSSAHQCSRYILDDVGVSFRDISSYVFSEGMFESPDRQSQHYESSYDIKYLFD